MIKRWITKADASAGKYLPFCFAVPARIRPRFIRSLLAMVVAFGIFPLACSGPSASLHQFSGQTMGTTYSVKIVKETPGPRPIPYERIQPAVDSLLREVNRQMSTYQVDSEISRFNQFRDTTWFAISEDFAKVLQASYRISEASGGAFDFTVGPLVNLWGFGPEKRDSFIPDSTELRRRQALVGYQKIQVRRHPPAVKKNHPEMYCDLSATAKGFGVDKICEYLESLTLQNYLVEIGGEVRARGVNERGSIWVLGIQSPDQVRGIQKIVHLENRAMATSGDYFNYYEVDGKRYSHTIDPRTGKPITHNLASVTVLHDSCMIADGLATALDVMGPEKGFAFAVQRKLPVYMIVRANNGFEEKMTPEFQTVLGIKNE